MTTTTETSRKLASIQRAHLLIDEYPNLPGYAPEAVVVGAGGADNHSCIARVLGWSTIVRGVDISELERPVVFFESDSFLPIEPRYEFMRYGCYKKLDDGTEGFLVTTYRRQGITSYGLVMPLSAFPELSHVDETHIGNDVTEILGVKKFEPRLEIEDRADSKCIQFPFPRFIPKTDFIRAQSVVEWWSNEQLREMEFEQTEKVDGCSVTVFHNSRRVGQPDGVCSHKKEVSLNDIRSPYVKIVNQMHLLEAIARLGNYAIQCEMAGPKIRGNPLGLYTEKLYLFSIYNIDEVRYLPAPERHGIFTCLQHYCPTLKHVPVMNQTSQPFLCDIGDIVSAAKLRASQINPEVKCEGFVFKSNAISSMAFKVVAGEG